MPEKSFITEQYKLRAGAPMPVAGGVGNFVLHTFMAEQSEITVFLCTDQLPASAEFRGQGGDLMSASFNRLLNVEGETFSGQQISNPEYIEETQLGFNF